MSDLVTVRIPELPAHVELSLADQIAIWSAEDNKTRKSGLTDLRTLILTGGNSSATPPTISGASYILRAGPAEDGTNTFHIPELAGKTFILRREGFGALPVDSYEILNAGGFRILNGALITINEVFELEIYELQGALPNAASSTALINGTLVVTTNFTLLITHLNKLIQLRASSTPITLTLPSVADVAANSILIIESSISNTVQHTIKTTGGQNLYFQNTGKSTLIMGVSETLWLYRGEDGWYVIQHNGNLLEVGTIQSKFKVGINETLLDGRIVSRASFPRLWEYAQTLGVSLVDELTWSMIDADGNRPYQGCFSTGDGSTTFRLPDFMNMAVRGLKNDGGLDTLRPQNIPGGFQKDMVGPLTGSLPVAPNANNPGSSVYGRSGELSKTYVAFTGTGPETIMKNIGILWTIKI